MACMTTCAFAHTGDLIGGEPPETDLTFSNLDTISSQHDEDPELEFKGWWWVSVTNNSGTPWLGMNITAGAGDLVAIVQGDGLEDENGFVGNSVVASRPGVFDYYGSYGSRIYDTQYGQVTGNLYAGTVFTFGTPLANTQKVAFKIYTDNSYYDNPASSFCVCLTPVVPEPGSLLALSGGLIGVAGFALRRRR